MRRNVCWKTNLKEHSYCAIRPRKNSYFLCPSENMAGRFTRALNNSTINSGTVVFLQMKGFNLWIRLIIQFHFFFLYPKKKQFRLSRSWCLHIKNGNWITGTLQRSGLRDVLWTSANITIESKLCIFTATIVPCHNCQSHYLWWHQWNMFTE